MPPPSASGTRLTTPPPLVPARTESEEVTKARSNHVQRKIEGRKAEAKVDAALDHQFAAGRLYACLSSRPGQSGRADGYILEGQELAFYIRKLKK
ncbi:MAG: hypothetical protein BYD32DRAFT_184858 [Podila humilis]|nr:MAG: hypothetical protein BYD32DRAFT_184858 [Podila humilis]